MAAISALPPAGCLSALVDSMNVVVEMKRGEDHERFIGFMPGVEAEFESDHGVPSEALGAMLNRSDINPLLGAPNGAEQADELNRLMDAWDSPIGLLVALKPAPFVLDFIHKTLAQMPDISVEFKPVVTSIEGNYSARDGKTDKAREFCVQTCVFAADDDAFARKDATAAADDDSTSKRKISGPSSIPFFVVDSVQPLIFQEDPGSWDDGNEEERCASRKVVTGRLAIIITRKGASKDEQGGEPPAKKSKTK
jgi:hypothetical protein